MASQGVGSKGASRNVPPPGQPLAANEEKDEQEEGTAGDAPPRRRDEEDGDEVMTADADGAARRGGVTVSFASPRGGRTACEEPRRDGALLLLPLLVCPPSPDLGVESRET